MGESKEKSEERRSSFSPFSRLSKFFSPQKPIDPTLMSSRKYRQALQSYHAKHEQPFIGAGPSYLRTRTQAEATIENGQAVAVLPTLGPIFTRERIIQEAEKHLVNATPANLHWAYSHEVSIRAMTKLIIQSICGAGFEYKGDPTSIAYIKGLFEDKLDLEEFVDISITNLVRNGNQLWKLHFDDDNFEGLFALPWEHIKVYRHPFFNWRTFILGGIGMEVQVPSEFKRKLEKGEKFTREDWEKIEAKKIETVFMSTTQLKALRYKESEVVFLAIDTKGTEVGESPLSPILTLICYKKLLEWIAMRCTELWSSPILELTTGLPTLPPESPEEIKELRDRVVAGADMLEEYREFGIFSLPFDQKLVVHFPSQGMPDFTGILDWLGKEIVLAILGSKALFEARGVELATSRTIKSVWDEALGGWRRLLKKTIDKQIIKKVLAKKNMKPCEIIFKTRVWSEEEIKAKLQAITRGERKA